MILKQSLISYKSFENDSIKKKLWNLGTEVNHLEMKEIKSVKLRDNLKIHQRQTGHIVISIQMMRHLFLAVANIISEHRSNRKKIM